MTRFMHQPRASVGLRFSGGMRPYYSRYHPGGMLMHRRGPAPFRSPYTPRGVLSLMQSKMRAGNRFTWVSPNHNPPGINTSGNLESDSGLDSENISSATAGISPALPTLPGSTASLPFVVFDLAHCESHFQKSPLIQAESERLDQELSDVLLQRHTQISPDMAQLAQLNSLVAQFTALVDEMVVNPALCTAAKVVEIRQVGTFKEQTMLRGETEAELVLLISTLPTLLSVEALATFSAQRLQKVLLGSALSSSGSSSPLGPLPIGSRISVATTTAGFRLSIDWPEGLPSTGGPLPSLQVRVCTTRELMSSLDAEIHLGAEVQQQSMRRLRQIRWFEEHATHMSVRMLIRLLRDLASRIVGLHLLSPWAVDLLSHYAIMNNPSGQPMPVHSAFRRVFQLLAAGLFLPGSPSIGDPSLRSNTAMPRVHTYLSLEQQDELCCTAQTLLRMFAHGGAKSIMLSDRMLDIRSQMTGWGDILVAPSEPVVVYEEEAGGTAGASGNPEDGNLAADVYVQSAHSNC